MSAVVASRIKPPTRVPRRRTLEDRLLVRAPGAYEPLSRLVMRLRPGSILRRVLLRRRIASSFAAFNRSDFEPLFVQFAPDVEYRSPPGARTLGLPGTVRGRDALRQAYATAVAEWEQWRITPEWLLDLGEVLVMLGMSEVRGRESGMELESQWASIYWISAGLVARQRDFLSWGEALSAVELDPDSIPVS